MFSKNRDGLLCLGASRLDVRDPVTQIVETRFRLGSVKACWDDGISSSESERFFCGDLIGEIGGGLFRDFDPFFCS